MTLPNMLNINNQTSKFYGIISNLMGTAITSSLNHRLAACVVKGYKKKQ